MEIGSVVTALVKEYTETTSNMFIYFQSNRVSMRNLPPHSCYLFETKDEQNNYKPEAAFTDKNAVVYLICEMVALEHNSQIIVELKSEKGKRFAMKVINIGNAATHRSRAENIMKEFFKVLECETSIM